MPCRPPLGWSLLRRRRANPRVGGGCADGLLAAHGQPTAPIRSSSTSGCAARNDTAAEVSWSPYQPKSIARPPLRPCPRASNISTPNPWCGQDVGLVQHVRAGGAGAVHQYDGRAIRRWDVPAREQHLVGRLELDVAIGQRGRLVSPSQRTSVGHSWRRLLGQASTTRRRSPRQCRHNQRAPPSLRSSHQYCGAEADQDETTRQDGNPAIASEWRRPSRDG